jgi:hypothetical protein
VSIKTLRILGVSMVLTGIYAMVSLVLRIQGDTAACGWLTLYVASNFVCDQLIDHIRKVKARA